MRLYHTGSWNWIRLWTRIFPAGVLSVSQQSDNIIIQENWQNIYNENYSRYQRWNDSTFANVSEALTYIEWELKKQYYDRSGRDVIGDDTVSLVRIPSDTRVQVIFNGTSTLTHSVWVYSSYDNVTWILMPAWDRRGHNYICRADIAIQTLRRNTTIEQKWVVNDAQWDPLFDIWTKRQRLTAQARVEENISLNPVNIFDWSDADPLNNAIVQNGAKFYIKVDKPIRWRPLNLYIITNSSNADPIQ